MAKTSAGLLQHSQSFIDNASILYDLNSVPGLIFWLDASEYSTLGFNSGEVETWTDKSFRKLTLTAPTSARRGLYSSSEKSVYFPSTATSKYLDNSLNIKASSNGEYTLFIVCKVVGDTSVAGAYGIFGVNCDSGLGTTGRKPYIQMGGVNQIQLKYGTTDSTLNKPITPFNSNYALATARYASGNDYLSVNNGAESSYSRTAITSQEIYLVRVGNFIALTGMDFYFREIIYFNRCLSSQEITNINTYLNSKWGLY